MLFAIYSSALGTCSVYDSGLYIITRRQLHRTIGTDTRNSEECQVLLFLSPASYEIKRSRWSPYIHTIYTHLRAHACARAHTHTHTHTHTENSKVTMPWIFSVKPKCDRHLTSTPIHFKNNASICSNQIWKECFPFTYIFLQEWI